MTREEPSAGIRLGRFFPLLVIALVLVAKVGVAARAGLAKDEGYYALWSVYPSPGYLDHPPAVAWIIAFGRIVLGETVLGIRLGALLAGIVVLAAVYRTGHLLFDRRAARLAALWYALTIATGLDFLITPDTPSVLFWTLAVWALAEFIAGGNPWWWLAVGAFAGLGVEGKYTDLFLGLGLVLLTLSSRERRGWLRLWQLWAGGALTLLMVVPNFLWNAGHGWATLFFQGRRIGDTLTSGNLPELIAAEVLLLGPGIVAFAILAILVLLFRKHTDRRNGFVVLVLTTMPLWLYFLWHALHARVEANWLLPSVPATVLLAAACATRPWTGLARGWVRFGVAAQTLFGAAAVVFLYTQILFSPLAVPALDRTRELQGWTQLQNEISDLAEANNARWVAVLGDYPLTGQLVTYGRIAGDPLPIQPLGEPVRYAFLPGLPAQVLQQPALYVATVIGEDIPDVPGSLFATSQFIATVSRRNNDDIIERYAVYRVEGLDPRFVGSPGGGAPVADAGQVQQ